MMLLLACAALLIGPAMFPVFRRHPVAMNALDAFIFVAIGGLVIFHILPEVLEQGSLWMLMFVALGFVGPSLVESVFQKVARRAHEGTLLFAAIGLALHAVTDGAAVSLESSIEFLDLSIILHRLPVGLTVFWLVRPHFGARFAWMILGVMVAATVAGGVLGTHWLSMFDATALAWFQALVAGSVLHVVFHRPYHEDHPHQPQQLSWIGRHADGLGSILGLAILLAVLLPHWLLGHDHGHHHPEPVQAEVHAHHAEHAEHAEHEEHEEHEEHVLGSHHDADEPSVGRLLHGEAVVDAELAANAELLHVLAVVALNSAPWLITAYLLFYGVAASFNRQRKRIANSVLKSTMALLLLPVGRRWSQEHSPGLWFALGSLLGLDVMLLALGLLPWSLSLIIVITSLSTALAYLGVRRATQSKPSVESILPNLSVFSLIGRSAPWLIVGWCLVAFLSLHLTALQFSWSSALLLVALLLPFHVSGLLMVPLLGLLWSAGWPPEVFPALWLAACGVDVVQLRLLRRATSALHMMALIGVHVSCAVLLGGLLAMLPWPTTVTSNLSLLDFHQSHWLAWGALVMLCLLLLQALLHRGARGFFHEIFPEVQRHHHH